MDSKFGVLLFLSANICAALALPPCVCTRNFKPVCGSDGKTYSNACVLECENYKNNAAITVTSRGTCELQEPPSDSFDSCICPFLYQPVCGTDGVTYPNKCNLNCNKLRSANLEMRHEGNCQENEGREPVCECPRVKKPVCGSDGNTYSNDCLLNCATKDNSQLRISHNGRCDNKVKVVDSINY